MRGLDREEVRARQGRYGLNRLRETKGRSAFAILIDQFKSLIIALLGAAAILSFAFGEFIEGLAVVIVILLNAAIGFITELRATRSMEALHEMSSVEAKVMRGGIINKLSARELVPGDIVVFEGGDIVTADLRIIEASKLQADESALTGESVPVSKTEERVREETRLHDRTSMLFKGTFVTRGSGRGIVVSTGMDTELGRISSLVEEAEEERTPLEKRLDQLGNRLIWATLIIAALTAASGILAGKEVLLMVETSIALAVAAIPEGLPIVATIALARGMWRMARRNVLINRLSAVETLGATTIICTDKTGTLTENRMTLEQIAFHSDDGVIHAGSSPEEGWLSNNGKRTLDPYERSLLREILTVGVLCNNASLEERSSECSSERQEGSDGKVAIGDPMETALLVAGAGEEIDRSRLLQTLPEAREVAFDPSVKMMATFHEKGNGEGYFVAVKGAPEEVLHHCTSARAVDSRAAEDITNTDNISDTGDDRTLTEEEQKRWLDVNAKMAAEGMRVLAAACRDTGNLEADPYDGLTFLGLIGMLDPPRNDVRKAIRTCQGGGIRIIMVTGDQALTARKIALDVGLVDEESAKVIEGSEVGRPGDMTEDETKELLEAPIFCRVSPEQKLDLIDLHQSDSQVVAMTGDGVNDAPALKKSDIGVAMGRRGTQVAREASEMIIQDDAFSSIVAAVEQGRIIFGNIRKFVLYLLSCNVSEIMTVSVAALFGAPLPILPLQILFLNLVTDVFPALALGMGRGEADVMKHPPRNPREPVLTSRHWWMLAGFSGLITLSVLGSLFIALVVIGMGQDQAVTVSFLTLAFAQLWHVFNIRNRDSRFLVNEITRNAHVWGALALCSVLLMGAVFVPGLATVLRVINPGWKGWLVVLGMSLVPWLVGQIVIALRKSS
jgi:Ca2+-transporting ATPase